MWCVVVATHAEGRLIGFLWMGVGIVTYVVYRKLKGYSLTRTIARVVVPASMQADIDYDRILVPIVGTRITDEMMVLACQLATEKGSAIDALYVIEVPLNLPLDAELREQRARAERVLGAAGLIAEQFKVHFAPIIVTARHAGRAIVEEADAAPLRGHHPRHGQEAAHRRTRLRQHGRPRDRLRALRGAAQPRAARLPHRRGEHRGGDAGGPAPCLPAPCLPAPSLL